MAEKYTVLGAGNGGKVMAAHLALMGADVALWNRTFDHISVIKKRGGVELESPEGGPHGFGKLTLVTPDIAEAIQHAQVIMVVLPSSAHADVAKMCAPHLKDGQIVVLHPGRTLGAMEFTHVIRDNGCTADVTVAEAETFIYASRTDGPAQGRIFRIKDAVPLAALPSNRNEMVLEAIHHAYPQYIDGVDILHTGLNNMGAIFHPALTILNSGWIEHTHGDYQFYIDGVTPSVARVLEVLDRERVTVGSALGLRVRTALDWLKLAYNSEGEDLYEAIQNQQGYYGIKAPATLKHRYLFEDIPMSMVPMASLGMRYGVSVRGMDSIIRLGNIMHRTDYWRRGRTVDRLGFQQWSVSELTQYVKEGRLT
ncbi:MAG: NAD/NADP octopine/nopaline dehydrogenase family protein [Anaerolineales bacterium]|nr:NAD/NADP octopine/nopaline dehydrogenase family protein [Anaerolineales bacterium]MCB9144387.1 NAD/NADP octopine/nopaline dehydrogenase family protein [Anaerolineales bacterium]